MSLDDMDVGIEQLPVRDAVEIAEPPLWMQHAIYPANVDRALITAAFRREGVVDFATDIRVGPRGEGANMTVDVTPGAAVVEGTDAPDQGKYLCRSHELVNLAVDDAPGAGLTRIDTVVARVYDDAMIGGDVSAWALEVIRGTAAATPVRPALPFSSYALADVTVPAGIAAVTPAQITDRRAGVGAIAGRVYQTANINIANWTAIPCPAIDYLTGGMRTSGGGGLEVPIPGLYAVTFGVGSVNGPSNAMMVGNVLCRVQYQGIITRVAANYVNLQYGFCGFADHVRLAALDQLNLFGFATGAGQCDPANGHVRPSWISAEFVSE